MTRRWMLRTAAILAAMLLAGGAGGAAAQGSGGPPPRSGGGRGGPGAGPGPGRPQVDDEMRAALEQVMRVRLKRALQMTPGQEERVMPQVDKLQEARHDFVTRRRAAVSHLRAVMIDETSRPADIEKALREVRGIESSFRGREESLRADLNAELDPRQQARLYFFEERFRRDMQRRLMEGGGPGAGPGAAGGPGAARGRGPAGPPPDDPDPDGGGDDDL